MFNVHFIHFFSVLHQIPLAFLNHLVFFIIG